MHPAVNGVAIAADPQLLHNDLHTYLAGERTLGPLRHERQAAPQPNVVIHTVHQPNPSSAECGVDGVKVDVQSTITMFGFDSGTAASCFCKLNENRNGMHVIEAAAGMPLTTPCNSTSTPHAGGYAAMGARWHRSLEESVARHLPGRHQINSMCCAIEDIYK